MLDLLTLLGAAVIIVCLVGIFFCSLAEAAMLGISETARRRLAESREVPALRLARLLGNGHYLSTIIVSMNSLLIVLSTVMTLLVHHLHGPTDDWTSEFMHMGMVLFILVFAELTPKTYGGLYPEAVGLRVAQPIAVLTRLYRPLVRLLTRLAGPVTGHGGPEQELLTIEEIRMAADVSEEEGMVEPEEAEMLDHVMDLGETRVGEIMVPRVAMIAAEDTLTVAQFAALASSSGLSRIPLYHETVDTITGIVYVKDLLRRLAAGESSLALDDLARPPLYIPATKRIDDLLHELREKRVHIAIVVDEFGGTAGLVTIEDILEELVGEIEDEHDPPSEDIVALSEKELRVDGRVRIEDVNTHLAVSLPDEQYETIGGLLSGLAGRIPATGEVFQVGSVRLIVEQSDGQHLEQVRIVAGTREDGDD